MTELPAYHYKCQVANEDGIAFNTIIRDPRIYKPQDLITAADNVGLFSSQVVPAKIAALAEYISRKLFILLHRTGLYNRQRSLWDSLSRIQTITIQQQQKGWLRKEPIPVFDFHFSDQQNRVILCARLLMEYLPEGDTFCESQLMEFIADSRRHSAVSGLLFCSPEPLPDTVSNLVKRLTQANDPVGRYESRLSSSPSVTLDILTIAEFSKPNEQTTFDIQLVIPDLSDIQRPRTAQ